MLDLNLSRLFDKICIQNQLVSTLEFVGSCISYQCFPDCALAALLRPAGKASKRHNDSGEKRTVDSTVDTMWPCFDLTNEQACF